MSAWRSVPSPRRVRLTFQMSRAPQRHDGTGHSARRPAGVIFTVQYDLKSDVCAFTSSSEAAPDRPRR